MTTASRKCSKLRADSQPCKAWAIHGTDPPLCAGRAIGGAPPRNTNAQTLGFYSPVLSEDELADLVLFTGDLSLDDEIALARVILRRRVALLSEPAKRDPEHTARISSLALQATRTFARLLRDQRALSGQPDAGRLRAGCYGKAGSGVGGACRSPFGCTSRWCCRGGAFPEAGRLSLWKCLAPTWLRRNVYTTGKNGL